MPDRLDSTYPRFPSISRRNRSSVILRLVAAHIRPCPRKGDASGGVTISPSEDLAVHMKYKTETEPKNAAKTFRSCLRVFFVLVRLNVKSATGEIKHCFMSVLLQFYFSFTSIVRALLYEDVEYRQQ